MYKWYKSVIREKYSQLVGSLHELAIYGTGGPFKSLSGIKKGSLERIVSV